MGGAVCEPPSRPKSAARSRVKEPPMPQTRTAHPTPQQLADYGLGKPPEDQRAIIAEHLTVCDECRRCVEGLPSLSGDVVVPTVDQPPSESLLAAAREMAGLPADLPLELAQSQKYRI